MKLDPSKNLIGQIHDLIGDYMAEQTQKDVPYYEALSNVPDELEKILAPYWKDPEFRKKLAHEITKEADKNPDFLEEIFEMSKPYAKREMDETMDLYNAGKITKKQMEEILKKNSIIYEEKEK